VAGGPIDGRSDLYSLGIVAFQLLSGKLPFDAPQPATVLLKQATQPPPVLSDVAAGVPRPLAAVAERALCKEAADRYPTGEAMAEALEVALRESQSDGHAAPERVLDETTAKAVWLRAAQLQADASRRVHERTARAEEFATGIHQAQPTSGYRQGDVEAAAVQAGIGEEFVQLALAELPDDAAVLAARHEVHASRFTAFMLGTVERSLSVSRVIPATPARTLELIGQVFPASPWDLTFRDTVGGHPLDGGVITFSMREPTSADHWGGNGYNSLKFY